MLRPLDLRPRIAWHVRRLRVAAGRTQVEVAVEAGIHLRHYQRLEGGCYNITVQTLAMVAAALEVDVLELLAPMPDGATLGPQKRGPGRKR